MKPTVHVRPIIREKRANSLQLLLVIELFFDADIVFAQIMYALDTKRQKFVANTTATGRPKNISNAWRLPNQQFWTPNLKDSKKYYGVFVTHPIMLVSNNYYICLSTMFWLHVREYTEWFKIWTQLNSAFTQTAYLLKLIIPTTNALPRWRLNVEM